MHSNKPSTITKDHRQTYHHQKLLFSLPDQILQQLLITPVLVLKINFHETGISKVLTGLFNEIKRSIRSDISLLII